jgi:hypothetical protein
VKENRITQINHVVRPYSLVDRYRVPEKCDISIFKVEQSVTR